MRCAKFRLRQPILAFTQRGWWWRLTNDRALRRFPTFFSSCTVIITLNICCLILLPFIRSFTLPNCDICTTRKLIHSFLHFFKLFCKHFDCWLLIISYFIYWLLNVMLAILTVMILPRCISYNAWNLSRRCIWLILFFNQFEAVFLFHQSVLTLLFFIFLLKDLQLLVCAACK